MVGGRRENRELWFGIGVLGVLGVAWPGIVDYDRLEDFFDAATTSINFLIRSDDLLSRLQQRCLVRICFHLSLKVLLHIINHLIILAALCNLSIGALTLRSRSIN